MQFGKNITRNRFIPAWLVENISVKMRDEFSIPIEMKFNTTHKGLIVNRKNRNRPIRVKKSLSLFYCAKTDFLNVR